MEHTDRPRVHITLSFQAALLGLGTALIVAILVYIAALTHIQQIADMWAWIHGYVYTGCALVALFLLYRLVSKIRHIEKTRALSLALMETEQAQKEAEKERVTSSLRLEQERMLLDHAYRMTELQLRFQHFTIPQHHTLAVKGADVPFSIVQGQVPALLGAGQSNQVVNANEPGLVNQVLSFHDLLINGTVQTALAQGKMLLGYQDGQLRFGSWLDLYSCGIGGVSGSGKTTTVRFLLFQAILAGARLIMIDPHIGDEEESLAAQFACFKDVHLHPPCDEDAGKIAKRVRWLMKEYLRRKKAGDKRNPIILVIDELNAAIRRMDDELKQEMSDLLLTIAQEGRKFGIFAMLIGQRWSEQDLGGKGYGAAIRSSLSSKLAHRFTDEGQAKLFISGKWGSRTLELKQGSLIMCDTHGEYSIMQTPYTTSEDGAYIQRLLDQRDQVESTYETTEESTQSSVLSMPDLPRKDALYLPSVRAENSPIELSETTQKDIPATPYTPNGQTEANIHTLAMSVAVLAAQGTPKNDIMRQIWHVNPGGSSEYKAANEQYQQIMQYIAEKLGA